jgi:2-polyprenyl-3-methyl-5-hydroxy-6-metoxy-1,4-benzoquinol methylase
MKISGGQQEDGIVYGNTFDKYSSRNPIVRTLMNGFDKSLSDLIQKANPSSIHEIGCGEGYWTMRLHKKGIETKGSDFSSEVIALAQKNAREQAVPPTLFSVKSIYDLKPELDYADLIICCEVFEHLESPEKALDVLKTLVGNDLIVSVPREPIWRLMNMARGKYITDLGNTPGHIQHWSKTSFVNLIQKHFEIIDINTPLPWTMLLCRPKK